MVDLPQRARSQPTAKRSSDARNPLRRAQEQQAKPQPPRSAAESSEPSSTKGWTRSRANRQNAERSLFVADLLTQVALVAEFLDLMHLRFEPIDVHLLILKQPLEQFARGVVA